MPARPTPKDGKPVSPVAHDWLEANEGRCRWCCTPFREGGCGSYQIAAFYGPASTSRPFEWYPPVAETCTSELAARICETVNNGRRNTP